ncbi:MAG: cytochrome c oxidase subunit II [Bacteroidetes bacterium]|nr:cytochrome c oxidase subunit II [Bacteroidota bacterium]
MFSGPSENTGTVDMVMLYIVGVSVLLLVGITITMIYFVFKYNRKKGHKPVDIHGNVWLEILWIAIPTILVLSMFYYGYNGFVVMRTIPENAMEIKVTARMWEWKFDYENGKSSDTLYVPVGQPINLVMESVDVNHSLFIPAFRIKEDVIAGIKTHLGFTADEAGTYIITCAEYCGLKHSMMYTAVKALPLTEFNNWLEGKTEKQIIDESVSLLAEKLNVGLLHDKGCITCHSLDGSIKQAPSFLAINGRKTVILEGGEERTITVDDNYLRKSIMDPYSEIVKGYPAIMPEQKRMLNEDEVNQIIGILKALN